MAPLAHALALLAMAMAVEMVTLDMAENSFDDQYQGCGQAMAAALPALNRSEFQLNPLFARVWPKAVAEWQSRGSRVSPLASSAQAIAIMAYTMNDLYQQFNAATRTAGSSPQHYHDNFHFKTLHFLLTDALATLRRTQGRQCRCVFRGMDLTHFTAKQGQRVRFGQFTSTTVCRGTAQKFGTDTVFKMETCYGMDIHDFSRYPHEQEVLVPPFETFEVTKVTQKGGGTLIELRPTGTFSKYNCEWLGGGSVPVAPFHLGGFLLATTALAVATGIL